VENILIDEILAVSDSKIMSGLWGSGLCLFITSKKGSILFTTD